MIKTDRDTVDEWDNNKEIGNQRRNHIDIIDYMDSHGNYVLAHLSDLHLGYKAGHKLTKQGINWREADGYKALDEVVHQILSEGTVDAVLIAGDVFHTPEPSIRSILFAQREFRILADNGIPVYCISGNHDQSDIRAEIAASAVIDDRDAGIYSHAEPYAIHEIFPDVWLHMVSHHLFSEQAATFDKVKPFKNAVNLFTAHGTMIDPDNNQVIHMDAPAPREIIIPSDMMKTGEWDYCLLGHIHERRYVGRNKRTLYNGSLIRRGFSDGMTSLGRGWTKWTLMNDGTMKPEFKQISQRPQSDYPVIDAKNMTASEISGLILDRLHGSLDSMHSGAEMPILRQKIINISPEKKKSLDTPAISELASGALIWGMTTQTIDETEKAQDKTASVDSNGTIADRYSSWLGSSNEYNAINDDNMRKQVEANTKDYIRKGQEESLDE